MTEEKANTNQAVYRACLDSEVKSLFVFVQDLLRCQLELNPGQDEL